MIPIVSLNDEQPVIAFVLEHIDGELSTLQDVLSSSCPTVRSQNYHMLEATLHEMIFSTLQQRVKLITWGLSMGLTGINIEETIGHMEKSTKEILPHVYHDRITTELNHIREWSTGTHHSRGNI